MKRILRSVGCVLVIAVTLVPLSCRRDPVRQSNFITNELSPEQSEVYSKAEELFNEKRYDDVIQTLTGPAYANPTNFKLNVLLAKAQLEKCAILKERGDPSYKILIHQPYETGKRLHELQVHPELYYITAKSLLINNRPARAKKNIRKALYYSPNNPDYLLVLGDAYLALSKFSKDDPDYEKRLLTKAKAAYERAVEIKKEVESSVNIKLQQISEKLK